MCELRSLVHSALEVSSSGEQESFNLFLPPLGRNIVYSLLLIFSIHYVFKLYELFGAITFTFVLISKFANWRTFLQKTLTI